MAGATGAATVFATAANTEPEAAAGGQVHPGESPFAAHCAFCHNARDVAARFRSAQDPDRLAAELLAFLQTHGRADGLGDAQILAYLTAKAAAD